MAVNDQGEAGYWGYELGRSQQTGVDYLPNPNHPDDVGTVYFSSWDVVKTWHHSANMAGRLPHGGDGDPGTGTTGGHTDTQEPLTKGEIDGLRSAVHFLVDDEACNKFVTAVLGEDAITIFNRIAEQGGFYRGHYGKDALASERGWPDKPSITINADMAPMSNLSASTPYSKSERGAVVIHEEAHGVGLSHFGMAILAEKVSLALGYENVGSAPQGEDYPDTLEGWKAWDKASSRYFDDRLWAACYRGPTGRR